MSIISEFNFISVKYGTNLYLCMYLSVLTCNSEGNHVTFNMLLDRWRSLVLSNEWRMKYLVVLLSSHSHTVRNVPTSGRGLF